MKNEDNYSYIDISFRELKAIRDAITDVLDEFAKADA